MWISTQQQPLPPSDFTLNSYREIPKISRESSQKLRLEVLTALVIGSITGRGIFSPPQNTAASAGVDAVLIGWAIIAVGMLILAFVFQTLANHKPELGDGVYTYTKIGFGDYMGFSSAWGYWISAWLGNVGCFVLLSSILDYFFPILGRGDIVAAIACVSVLLWALHFLMLHGIREAVFTNTVTTVTRVVPLFLFTLICLLAFELDIFATDIWGKSNPDLSNVMNQMRNMVLVTVQVFIGVKNASIFSSRAEKRSNVGKITVIDFITVLLLLVLVNMLSMGAMTQLELAELQNPSVMLVLEHMVSHWGAVLISVGLLISLLDALLSWVLLCTEIMFVAAEDHTMPEFLRRKDANQISANALWLTNICVQVFLVVVSFTSGSPSDMDPYTKMPLLAASMTLIPYFRPATYGLLLTLKGETYEDDTRECDEDLVIVGIAVVYAVQLLYAGGLRYLLLSALLHTPGAILFIKARHEVGQSILTEIEKLIPAAVAIGTLMGTYGLYDGFLTL